MQIPFFYIDEYDPSQPVLMLDEETSRHMIQVLRMKAGEEINLTDGKGNILTGEIIEAHKKKCIVKPVQSVYREKSAKTFAVGISLIKNSSRFEWFLEKATEIGIHEIIPLICERTEKQKFRSDRMRGILISAMLQSRQCWLPALHEPIAFELLFRQEETVNKESRFIAYCSDGDKKHLTQYPVSRSSLVLVGPEGDFSPKEIELALQRRFIPVSLGDTRLRTETAGIVAAALLANSPGSDDARNKN